MADLVQITFPSEEKAEQVRQKLLDLQKEYLIELSDAVIAVKQPNGHVKLNQERSGGRQPFTQVAPLSNVGDILLLDVQALQPTNGLGARGHLGVPSFQWTISPSLNV